MLKIPVLVPKANQSLVCETCKSLKRMVWAGAKNILSSVCCKRYSGRRCGRVMGAFCLFWKLRESGGVVRGWGGCF